MPVAAAAAAAPSLLLPIAHQMAGTRPAALRFEDEVLDDELPVVMRDVLAPQEAIAVSEVALWQQQCQHTPAGWRIAGDIVRQTAQAKH